MKDGIKEYLRFNVILAVCLILIGLLANPRLLALLTGMGDFTLHGKIVVITFDLFLIASGVLVFFKGNTREDRKRLVFSYIILVFSVLIIETILHLINFEIITGRDTMAPHERSPYAGREWGEELWEEIYETRIVFTPFIEWRTNEYHGEYVNIDSSGARKTWNPVVSNSEEYQTLYMFGGSTLWGFVARDDYTIPSFLSKKFNNAGHNVMVHNYGEISYISTQELLRLVLLLKEGHRPDYVIFYDGVNDAYAAYQSGTPGVQNIVMLKEKWGYSTSSSAVTIIFRGLMKGTVDILAQSRIHQAIGKIAVLFSPKEEFQEAASKYDEEQLQSLTKDLTGYFLETVDVLDYLADTYGFKYAVFWQPTLFTKRSITEEEANSEARAHDKTLFNFYQLSTKSLVSQRSAHFFDISDVFDNETDTVYIDISHTSEEGNEMIAERMFQLLEKGFLD